MPILYSVISRGTTVLAKYTECVGNFAEVTEQIIAKLSPENNKFTYSHGDYRIHYIHENRIVYMCITDSEFDRMRSFQFLSEIKQKFISTYGLQVATAIAYAMNSEFSKVLAEQMAAYSSQSQDSILRVREEVGELKDIMVENISTLMERGERLELLVNKTENLSNNSVAFRKASRNLARQMFWKKVRLYAILGAGMLFVIYVLVSMFCGGPTWGQCLN